MTPAYPTSYDEIGRTYAALRYGGAPQGRARAELGLPEADGAVLEAAFRRRRRGDDQMRPGFARHERHVAAVLAAGGFPAVRR
jgi:hypothetical protein